MDVAVSELRAQLRHWLQRAAAGDEIVVTDRGLPVVRITGINASGSLEQLERDGVISPPVDLVRPRATGVARPRPRRPVADRVSDARR